jgi:hypothetical protein
MTAFSCTCHPNMKEAKPHCAIERRNVLYVGFCHSSVKSVCSSHGVINNLKDYQSESERIVPLASGL